MAKLLSKFRIKEIVLPFILLIFVCNAYSQNTKIFGKAKDFIYSDIITVTFSDYLSQKFQKLHTEKIDSSASFSFDLNIKYPSECFLKIKDKKVQIFIEPGREYDLDIKTGKEGGIYYNIINEKTDDLNYLVHKLQYELNDFGIKNYNKIFKSRNYSLLDSFKIQLKENYKHINNVFFTQMLRYKIAEIEFLSRQKSRAELMQEYFTDSIQYRNPDYMDFFNDYFREYISINELASPDEIMTSVNITQSFIDFLKIFRRDSLLKRDDLVELVALNQLKEMFNKSSFNKENVLKIIRGAEFNCKTQANKQIAKNLYLTLNHLRAGTKSPIIDIKYNNKAFNINSLNDKSIYILFFRTDISQSVSELLTLNKFYDELRDYVEIVAISGDEDKNKLDEFLKNNKSLKIPVFNFNQQWEMLESFDISSYPIAVLIDKDKKIVSSNAKLPSSGLLNYLKSE